MAFTAARIPSKQRRLRHLAGAASVNSRRSLLSHRSILSIASERSILSIGSSYSILSIGSCGSVLSIGSVGSFGSALSSLSFASLGSALSGLSRWSLLAWRGDHAAPDEHPPLSITVDESEPDKHCQS
ncbi:hypothetical protein [Rhodococcus pyridinivorans]|uniref:hypothetical protein n=1 Tax=Rhodococcus pyridinivorans TaxID=103816 RepID=UPI00190900D1|nr:hypothetical protein [Rhodococcus pyridinivorans]QQM54285.1 hypothetical protein JGU70_06140 [Rhodococcus pyridinivorans]